MFYLIRYQKHLHFKGFNGIHHLGNEANSAVHAPVPTGASV